MKDYQQSTTNWRANLRANEKKTKLVIACFVGLYILLGLLVDIFFLMQNNNYTISSALISLLTFHNPPFATIIMLIIKKYKYWIISQFPHNYSLGSPVHITDNVLIAGY